MIDEEKDFAQQVAQAIMIESVKLWPKNALQDPVSKTNTG
jgi:hypothetical protein